LSILEKAGRNSPGMVAFVHDKYEILRHIEYSGRDVPRTIGAMFVDKASPDAVICSTIHRAKGLEADQVWLLEDGIPKPGKSAAEDNAHYVGITRAKRTLIRVAASK
jgi:superfamily I DNA/RNA helicase